MEKKNILDSNQLVNQKKIIKEKRKLLGIIFARAISCIGIVIFHYFCHSNGKFKFLYFTANSSFGFMFVTSFFCISGAVIYYNYPKINSIKNFYYKRWKSILFPYYISYFYFFLHRTFNDHKLFYKGNWTKFLFTLLGLDGYLSFKIQTYYLVGEWFVGPIIIIYILYPLLLFITKNNIIINNIILCFFYFLMYKKKFRYGQNTNIVTCIASFYFGIETIRYNNFYLTNKKIFIISILLLIILCEIKINFKFSILIFQIQGFSLFIVLYQIGKYVMKTKFSVIFYKISTLSYSIFLFHHHIICDILLVYNPTEWYAHLILLLISIILIILYSKIHFMIINSILKTNIFKKIDSYFI